SPGVTVDKDGNISLKGKTGVQVYIDGRPAYLSGADLANMLKSMSASQLDQIEIMTNPPAKYDAAGNSGIINIKTKKNKQFGYNGSFTVGVTQGHFPRTNESFNFNYRHGKVNIFSNISHNYNHRFQRLDIQRNFRDENTKDITSTFLQRTYMKNENVFYNAKVGMDYFATKNTTFGVVLNGFKNPSDFIANTSTDIYNATGQLRNVTGAYSRNDQHWKNFSGNVNFRHQFDSTGQEISVDADYISYNSKSIQTLVSKYYDNAGNAISGPDTLLAKLPQDITIYSSKADYTLPLKKGAKFEAGLKSSWVQTDNNAAYDSLVNGQLVHDNNRSNYFKYQENINAAYVNLSRPLSKKLSAQLGLRLENTHAKGNQVTTGQQFDRKYTQLFPTAYFQYSVNKKNQLGLNYGRRIERPAYEDLNPFIHFIDRYTYEQGNPDLRPQFAHNVELTHIYGGYLTTTLNYTVTKDILQEVLEQHEATNETFIKKANIAKLHQVGMSVSGYKEFKKWWSGSVYANGFNNRFEGVVNSEHVKLGVTSFFIQSQQQFKFGKGWSAEVSGWYRTRGLEGVIFIRPLGQFNFGLGKQIMKNKGSLRLNFRDPFNLTNFKGESRYGDVDAKFQNYNFNRSVSINFTYRFNKGKINANGQRKNGGAEDEQNRVKVGGN
ncbi:MAG TPA: outer membrane beta-barrel family protein, partial [Chitinophagaceae bacterium]